jgi:hypothetical protein
MIPALHGQPAKGNNPKRDARFDTITLAQIKKSVDNARKAGETRIDGSDNKNNRIPTGTILCYVTSDNRFGKLEVLEYGYNLAIKWVTYAKDGGVLSEGDRLVVRGTWPCDLDYGVEGNKGKSKPDFWWEQVDGTVRYLAFRNGAVFTVYPPKS